MTMNYLKREFMNQTEKIWEEYHNKLFYFIKSRVNDDFISKDILSDVFMKIHTKLNTVKDNSKIRSWIYQITRNTIVDYYRNSQIKFVFKEYAEKEQIDKNDDDMREGLTSCMSLIIEDMPQKYKNAIKLSEIEGRTQKEVACEENISLSGAKSRVQRGRVMLKKMLDECCEISVNDSNRIIDYIPKDKNCKYC